MERGYNKKCLLPAGILSIPAFRIGGSGILAAPVLS